MKDLTNNELQTLLVKIKSFCDVTWDNQDTDTKYIDFIKESIIKIDDIAGRELDYLNDSPTATKLDVSMNCEARELLKNRVFYFSQKALDDFDKNYASAINSLYLKGKIWKELQNAQNQNNN